MRIIKTRHDMSRPQVQSQHDGVETDDLHPPMEGAEFTQFEYFNENGRDFVHAFWIVR